MADARSLVVRVRSDGITPTTQQLNSFGQAAANAEQRVNKLVEAVDKMAQKFLSSASGTKALTEALNLVNSSTQSNDASMKSLAGSVERLASQVLGLGNKFQQGITSINQSSRALQNHTQQMSDAHAAARGLSGSLGVLWLTYGNAAPLAAGAAIGASLKSIISIGTDVQNTLENIRIKGENSAEEMANLSKSLTELSKGIYGPQEVVKALDSLTLAGLKANDAVNAIGAAMNLAIVGGTDINRAAEALVTIGSAVGATSQQYDYLADGISKAANISLASVDSIAEAVKRASVVNKLYGASFEDILTQTAALAQLGIKNTAAGTAITNFYANALGGTQKAKEALDALGFSFQDATGKAKPLVEAFEQFSAKLSKFDLKSQQKIITEIFGERALRDVEGLRDLINQAADSTERLADGTLKYKNKLEELQAQIKDSAGTSALQAAEQSLTTENLFKSMLNTLKSSFADAFKTIEPQIDTVIRKLREVFSSQDFQTMIGNIAKGFANLAEFIASNIGPITAIVEGIATFGAITAGGALFTRLIPVVQGLAVAFDAVAVGANGAAVATGIFGTAIKLLPGIGLILGAATAAYALYSLHADKAADSTKKLAEEKLKLANDYNTDFLKALTDEANRLDKVNQGLQQGLTLTEATLKSTKDLALEKQRNYNADAVTAAQKVVDEAKNNPKLYTFLGQEEALKQLTKAQNDLNAAKKKQQDFDTAASATTDRITKAQEFQASMMRAAQNTKDLLAEENAGTQQFNGKEKKGPNFFDSLIDSQNKWIAGAQARQDTMKQFISTGEDAESRFYTAQAKEELASIAAGKASKDLSAAKFEEYKNRILANAARQDELKTNDQALKDYSALQKSIQDQIKGNNAYFDSVANGTDRVVGKYSEQAAAKGLDAKLTQEQIDKGIALGKMLDEQIKKKDEIQKLEKASAAAGAKADELIAQAKSMEQYGNTSKTTALAIAQAKIEQLKWNDAATEAAAKNYLLNASKQTLAQSYVDLTKIINDATEGQKKAEADSVLNFADSEQAKIKIKAESLKKQAAMALANAQQAADANPYDPNIQAASLEAYGKYRTAIEAIDAESSAKINTANLQDWKKTVDNIVDTTLKGFDNIFDHGTSIWGTLTKSIRDMFKTTVIDYIKKEFAKPLVLNVVASVAGSLGFDGIANTATKMLGSAGGTGGAGSALSAVSSASSLYNLLQGGFDKIGSTVADGVQVGLNSAGLSSNFLSNGPFATAVGSLASSAAGIAAGLQLNKTLSGGYSISKGVDTVEKIATVAAAYFGPVGSTIAGAIGGVINRLFGRGPKEIQNQGIRGTVDMGGASGESYQNWLQKGGWFRSDKHGTDTQALSPDLINTFTSGFASLKTVSEGFAKTLNVSTDSLQGFSKTFDIAFGSDEQKNQEAVAKFFTDLGDEFATRLIPNIAEFSRQGETASQTLERLSNVFEATNAVAAIIGKDASQAFGSLGLASDAARERLVDLAGGIDKLASKATAYASTFLTDAEKLAPVQKAVTDALKALGLSSVTTKDQFKAIVNGLDLTTEAGATLFNNLMDLAPAFAQVADAADAATKAAADALKQAQQDSMDAAMKGVNSAFDALKRSVDAQKKIIDDKYNAETAAIKAAGDARKKAVQVELDAAKQYLSDITKVYSSLSNALASTKIESTTLDKARRESAQKYLAGLRGTDLTKASGLDSALGDVGGDSKKFFSTFEDYARDQAKTANTIKALYNQSDVAKSFAELTVDRLNDTITAIDDSTQEQLDAAQKRHDEQIANLDKIIDKAQQQIDALNNIDDSIQSLNIAIQQMAAAIAAASAVKNDIAGGGSGVGAAANDPWAQYEAAKLSGMKDIEAYGNQYGGDAYYLMNGVNDYAAKITNASQNGGVFLKDQDYWANVQALYDAGKHPTASQSIGNSISSGNKSAVEALYGSLLNRASDSAGLSYWAAKLEQGTATLDDIEKGIMGSDEYKKLHSFAVGTNFLPQDMLAKVHEGERIIPKADNVELMRRLDNKEGSVSNAEVKSLLVEIRDGMRTGDVSNVQITREVVKLLKKFDQDGLPPTRDTTG